MAFLHVQLLNLIVEVMAGCGLRFVAIAVLSSSCGYFMLPESGSRWQPSREA